MMNTPFQLTRRSLLGAITAFGALALTGCGPSPRSQEQSDSPTAEPRQASAQPLAMTVYRDPSCGCCEAWAEIARNAGYQVSVVDHPDMAAIKRQYGVPEKLLSCHTTVIGDYAIEGHVPIEHVRRLLDNRPAGIKGIAVAGMPIGSPGMEVPNVTKEPFVVMAFDKTGGITQLRA